VYHDNHFLIFTTLEDKMGLFSYDIKTMDDLFVHQLKDVYTPRE
jgi:hypothetical protein